MIRSAATGTLRFAEHALGRTVIGLVLYLLPGRTARLMRYKR
jgi:hypothetical protein